MQEVQKTEKRKDTRGRVLRTGESQRPDGSYQFRWSEGGERRTRYAPTLECHDSADCCQNHIIMGQPADHNGSYTKHGTL